MTEQTDRCPCGRPALPGKLCQSCAQALIDGPARPDRAARLGQRLASGHGHRDADEAAQRAWEALPEDKRAALLALNGRPVIVPQSEPSYDAPGDLVPSGMVRSEYAGTLVLPFDLDEPDDEDDDEEDNR